MAAFHWLPFPTSVFPNLDHGPRGACRRSARICSCAAEPKPEAILRVARDADALLATYAKDHGGDDPADDALPDHLALWNRRRQRRYRRGHRNAASWSPKCPIIAWTKFPITPWRLLLSAVRKIPFANARVQDGRLGDASGRAHPSLAGHAFWGW